MATEPDAPSAPLEPEVEETFVEFWQDIVCPNGEWDFDQIKRELADYRNVLDQVPKVYMEITGGAISKPHTLASAVLGVHEERCPSLQFAVEDCADRWVCCIHMMTAEERARA